MNEAQKWEEFVRKQRDALLAGEPLKPSESEEKESALRAVLSHSFVNAKLPNVIPQRSLRDEIHVALNSIQKEKELASLYVDLLNLFQHFETIVDGKAGTLEKLQRPMDNAAQTLQDFCIIIAELGKTDPQLTQCVKPLTSLANEIPKLWQQEKMDRGWLRTTQAELQKIGNYFHTMEETLEEIKQEFSRLGDGTSEQILRSCITLGKELRKGNLSVLAYHQALLNNGPTLMSNLLATIDDLETAGLSFSNPYKAKASLKTLRNYFEIVVLPTWGLHKTVRHLCDIGQNYASAVSWFDDYARKELQSSTFRQLTHILDKCEGTNIATLEVSDLKTVENAFTLLERSLPKLENNRALLAIGYPSVNIGHQLAGLQTAMTTYKQNIEDYIDLAQLALKRIREESAGPSI